VCVLLAVSHPVLASGSAVVCVQGCWT